MGSKKKNVRKPGRRNYGFPESLEERKILFSSLIAKEEKLYSNADVSRLFGVCDRTILRWRKQFKLPYASLNGTPFYSKKVLDLFLGFLMAENMGPDDE